MYRTWIIAVAAAFSISGASRAAAQSAPAAPAAAPALAPVGPTRSAAAISPTLALAEAPAAASSEAFARKLTNGQKLMILGGAILITGAIIGGDAGTIIMIGGGAVGIYGLYLQLGQPGASGAKMGLQRSF